MGRSTEPKDDFAKAVMDDIPEIVRVDVGRIAAVCNPFEACPWGEAVTREDVRQALVEGRLVAEPLPDNTGDHAGRIAYLVRHVADDPISMDVGVPEFGCHVEWPVVDGNHRLAAALYRNDASIAVNWSGSTERFRAQFLDAPMKTQSIEIQVKRVDVHPDYEIDPPDAACPLVQLTTALAQQMASHPDFNQARFERPADGFDELERPDRPLSIEVVLCKKVDDIETLIDSDSPNEYIGVFAMSAGAFNPDCWKADAFRVVVPCDMDYLRNFILEERNQELDPDNDRHDFDYLMAYLVTLTHELAHAREFIIHGQGFTPDEIDNYHDAGLINVDCLDVASGRFIRDDMLETDREDSIDIMETRVEAQGYSWLHWAIGRIDQKKVDAVLDCVQDHIQSSRKRASRKI